MTLCRNQNMMEKECFMKKLLCLLLALITLFSLVSCRVARGMPLADFSDVSSTEVSFADESTVDAIDSGITPLFWKVKSKDGNNVLWLFGSIHIADESLYPLPDVILMAYASCDALAVECNIVDDSIGASELMKKAAYSDGTTIQDHISQEVYLDAKKILTDAYGSVVVSQLDQYKPYLWYSFIDEIYRSKSRLKSEYGIDMYFIQKCRTDKKELIEIESVEFQTNMLFGFPDDVQELMLAEIVRAGQEIYIKGIEELYEAWMTGDIEKLEKILLDDDLSGYTEKEIQAIEKYNKAVITDRNLNMAEKAKEYLSQGKNVFYVVGLGHMIGEKGIVQLLKDAGYEVELIPINAKNSL